MLSLVALTAKAEDALWTKVSANAETVRQLAPGDIDVIGSASKPGKPVETHHLQSHLSHGEQETPIYTTIEVDPQPGPSRFDGKNFADMKTMVKLGDSLIDKNGEKTRIDGQQLDGKTWTVFKQEKSGAGLKLASKIWVDTDPACVHHIDADMHIPLYVDGTLKSSYVADARGLCLPRLLEADFDIIVSFKGGKFKISQTYANWVERPPSTVQH